MRFLLALALLTLISSDATAQQQWAHIGESVPASLCRTQEFVIATCPVGEKLASVCGLRRGQAIYRFGRPGHIELESTGLRHSNRGYSGGGETQVYFTRGGYTYILFDSTIRTGFGVDGLHYPKFSSGLLLKHSSRTRILSSCPGMDPAIVSGSVGDYMPEDTFIEHY